MFTILNIVINISWLYAILRRSIHHITYDSDTLVRGTCFRYIGNKLMTTSSSPRIQELRNFIQNWINRNNSNWSTLFKSAGISTATQSKISNLLYLGVPTAVTLEKLAMAMDLEPHILYVKAGLVPGDPSVVARVHSEYDLDSDEKALIDAVRLLPERLRRVVIEGAQAMSENL